MNDHNQSSGPARTGRVSKIGLAFGGIAAVLVILALVGWISRKSIVEGMGQSFCERQELECQIDVDRLDFGGVSLTGLDVREAGASESAVSAERLAVDFDWSSIFSPRAGWIGGQGIALRVDLTGEGSPLGGLGQVMEDMQTEADPGAEPAEPPRMNLRDVRIIGDTVWGPVEAVGRIVSDRDGVFDLAFATGETRLGGPEQGLDLAGAEVLAKIVDGEIDGAIKLDLERLETADAVVRGAFVDFRLEQAGDQIVGGGQARVNEVSTAIAQLAGAQMQADLKALAIDTSNLTLAGLASRVREMTVTGGAEAGSVQDANWDAVTLAMDIEPLDEGGAAGDVRIDAEGVTHAMGLARQVEIEGEVSVPPGGTGALARTVRASGVARLKDAELSEAARARMQNSVVGVFGGLLPGFSGAARDSAGEASKGFDLVLPWGIKLDDGGIDALALSGSEVRSKSGLGVVLQARADQPVLNWRSGVAGHDGVVSSGWAVAGVVEMSGGGAPPLTLLVDEARGDASSFSASVSGEVRPWVAGAEVVSASVRRLEISRDVDGGRLSGDVSASFTGDLGGVAWDRLRSSLVMDASWSGDELSVDSDAPLELMWDGADIGGVRIGGARMIYSPEGMLGAKRDGVVVGSGALRVSSANVEGGGFDGNIKLGDMKVGWAQEDGVRFSYAGAPSLLSLRRGAEAFPVEVGAVEGIVEFGNGWAARGDFDGVAVRNTNVHAIGGPARYRFTGGGGASNLRGSVDGISFLLHDPAPAGSRQFEDVVFEGQADLESGIVAFDGAFRLDRIGVQLGAVNGTHDIEAGVGSAHVMKTPLIFRPGSFQPKHISDVLRGVALVNGRADVSADAGWGRDGLNVSAVLDVMGMGFTVASAGVFEGVTGTIEIADVLKMRSAPGQVISIPKVTLGLPIEDGVVRFQLAGFDKVHIEGARWPFAGGAISLAPSDFILGPEESRILARAENWNLATLVEMFDIPDVKVEGVVSGDFPVVFSTGSARVVQAVLEASEDGGVIQYNGVASDAASQSDENAKMLFDALEDFRYRVLRLGLDGDVAGDMVLTLNLEGANPDVLNGAPFKLNIAIDSALSQLLNTMNQGSDKIRAAIGLD